MSEEEKLEKPSTEKKEEKLAETKVKVEKPAEKIKEKEVKK